MSRTWLLASVIAIACCVVQSFADPANKWLWFAIGVSFVADIHRSHGAR